MILGCENLKLFESIKPTSIRGDADPVARLTPLGWMIGGRTVPEPSADIEGESRVIQGDIGIANGEDDEKVRESNDKVTSKEYTQPKSPSFICRKTVHHDPEECRREQDELKRNLKRVWELENDEEVGRLTNSHYPAVKTVRQQRAEAMIMDHLKQLEKGHYQTKLLWSTDRRPCNNYVEAKSAYLDWERRLAKDEKTSTSFHVSMANWISSNYVENTENDPNGSQNFLTTFMVFKEGVPSDKGRMVVNGARKFKGECLNDFLEPGSNAMNDLSELLLKIRRFKYVVCCDLQNMFLNIGVAPEDRCYMRLFYRERPSEELKVYQFTVHAFGLASSPSVAMNVVKAHVKKHGERWPIAEKAIRENSLVDDIWLMSGEKAEIEKGMLEIVEVMEEMGITVHKWGVKLS